jgi:hypothetical protein
MPEGVGSELRDLRSRHADLVGDRGQFIDELRIARRGLTGERFSAVRSQPALLYERAGETGQSACGRGWALGDG